jgi:hypothetical protein
MFVFPLFALLLSPLAAEGSPIGKCDPVGGPALQWSAEERLEVRRMVRRGCKALGASEALCDFYDAVVVRESSGKASRRHTRGEGEHGVGPMGLNLASHSDKWPGRDEVPMFCNPYASLIVAHAVVWRAVTAYHASDLLDVQAVYSGRWYCTLEDGKRRCFADPNERTVRLICSRLEGRGSSCYAPLTRKDLGKRVPLRDRRAWVETMSHE